ncbi:hypothetical protein FHW19_004599 [Ochrobactrum anthropi]|uniref:DUF2865 domain-containing protein n=1 Tax=Brucella anthropi TaxID=529 RepID=UPI0015FA88CD|nr:DUF2865 domain-containing protein [Brucella anthropi]MBA8862847.1 hypothetical protein [Brucella anthropi]
MLVALADVVHAASCGVSAQSPVVKMLQRQLSALRAIERGRGCKPGEAGGGFFNACRDVGMQINAVQQELRTASAADRECKAITRSTQRPKATSVSAPTALARSAPGTDPSKKVRGSKNGLQYCVRLSDGYYFPTPNSQFGQKGGTDAALIQCKIICNTGNMAIYINDQNEEAAEMVSLETGQSYADLPTAYNYHGEGDFKRCDWSGYVAKVASLMTTSKQSKRLREVTVRSSDANLTEDQTVVAEIPAEPYRLTPTRTIRLVGPAFMPDPDNTALRKMRH